MDQLLVFGTGNAMVTKCYNTCFALFDGDEYFMVDAGGGNGILAVLEKMEVDCRRLHHIFITHGHTDHILGVVWMLRKIGTMILDGSYEGDLQIYCHAALRETILDLARLTMQKKFVDLIGGRIQIVPVADGEKRKILKDEVTFFDIHSTKAPQYGFTARLPGGKTVTCMGDEPFQPLCRPYIEGSDWLLSEAFCLYAEREKFKPYEKHHSTVRDACQLAESLSVKNLVLWHTEDKSLNTRKERYTAEGKAYYSGRLFVPDDLERITLD